MAKKNLISPLAPKSFPKLPAIAGCRLATARSGVRYSSRDDLTLMLFDRGATAAGVFTRSIMAGAPVDWSKSRIKSGVARALLVNAGVANVFTGHAGKRVLEVCAAAVAQLAGCRPNEVMQAATGVIAVLPDHKKIVAALPGLHRGLAHSGGAPGAWERAANAIRTTDTFAKGATATARIGGVAVRINGIAKGSGMIAPNMATMLAFIVTDAQLPAAVLRALLRAANEASFNAITVDSDTSTSDMALLFATAKAGNKPVKSAADPALKDFARALGAVMHDLALQIVRDGEGAEKLVKITVSGAASDKAARIIAFSIANSPLVKTAVAGADANWGRIVAAIGKAGQKADRDNLTIRIGKEVAARKGDPNPAYNEARATKHLQGREIEIAADVGVGRGQARVWTCDLTHRYIEINADYRS
jgi:glutamate N-acetyltransferase/amino-acid N-acetyltransferase